MNCKKCKNGKIFFEGVFGEDTFSWLELACIKCGKRWLLDINGEKYGGFVKRVLQLNGLNQNGNIPK